MSTISLPYEKQIRHFYVGNAIATETTIETFYSGASIGEVQVFGADGLNATTTGDFYIAKKNYKNMLSVSDLISGEDITYFRTVAPVAKTGKTQIFTLAGAPTAGDEYFMSLKVNYGNSEENFIMFYGSAKAVTGDTATTILTRVAKSLADNLHKSINTTSTAAGLDTIIAGTTAGKNKYITITVAGSSMTIA